MYIAISTVKKIPCSEPLILEYDKTFDEVSAKMIGGEFVGYVMRVSPDGCVPFEKIACASYGSRIIATSAVSFNGMLIASTDSPLLQQQRYYVREEIEGYGVLS